MIKKSQWPPPRWAPISLRFPLHSVDPSAQLNPRKSYDFLRETPFGRTFHYATPSRRCCVLGWWACGHSWAIFEHTCEEGTVTFPKGMLRVSTGVSTGHRNTNTQKIINEFCASLAKK